MVLVSISDVVEAIQNRTRCLIEGERVLDGNMLITVGSLGVSDARVLKVWALCLQSSLLSDAPHVIQVSLNLRTIYKRIVSISCSCKAGQSEKCKHCIAVLMYLNKMNEAEELEDLSCTDLTQQWGKLKKRSLSHFEAIPLREYCHYNPPSSIYAQGVPYISKNMAAEFAKMIIKETPTSEVFLHSTQVRDTASKLNSQQDDMAQELLMKRQTAGKMTEILLTRKKSPSFQKLKELTEAKLKTLPKDLLGFYNKHVQLTMQESVMLASLTANQSEEEWVAARKMRATGTKVYALYTYTKNKNPDWKTKMDKVFSSGFAGTPATMYGLEQEPFAREKYASDNGVKVIENGIVVHPDLPWLGTSVDGLVVDNLLNPQRLIEIKCLVAGKTKSATELPKSAECCDKKGKLKIRHKYNGQIQAAMFLLGLDSCDFILYASSDKTCVHQEVAFDEKFAYDLLQPLVNVYFDLALPYFCQKFNDPDTVESDAE